MLFQEGGAAGTCQCNAISRKLRVAEAGVNEARQAPRMLRDVFVDFRSAGGFVRGAEVRGCEKCCRVQESQLLKGRTVGFKR